MTKNSQIFAHTLLQQTQHQRFRKRDTDLLRQRTSGQRLIQATETCDDFCPSFLPLRP